MRADGGLDLTGREILLVGNGPSSWWIGPQQVQLIRRQFPDLRIAACNLTAQHIGADLAFALDRSMVDRFIDDLTYLNGPIVVREDVFRTAFSELGKLADARQDMIWGRPEEAGGNVFWFPPEAGDGTGLAAFQTILAAEPAFTLLIGFDAQVDPRTRWSGGAYGYKATHAQPERLQEWFATMLETYTLLRNLHRARDCAMILSQRDGLTFGSVSKGAMSVVMSPASMQVFQWVQTLMIKTLAEKPCPS